jgi:integrase/recombinase XerD
MSKTISPNNNHAARKVSPLRQRMIDDMTVRNLSAQTQASYVQYVSQLARYFDRSPEKISVEDIRTFLLYLANEKGLSPSARNVATHALRFFFRVTLRRPWTIETIPSAKGESRLPVILSQDEVQRLIDAAPTFTAHVILSTIYATGIRVSEAVHLRIGDVDSQRMMIRIVQGKGHKDRLFRCPPNFSSCCAPIGGAFTRVIFFSPVGGSINLSAPPKLWTHVLTRAFMQGSPKRRTHTV